MLYTQNQYNVMLIIPLKLILKNSKSNNGVKQLTKQKRWTTPERARLARKK